MTRLIPLNSRLPYKLRRLQCPFRKILDPSPVSRRLTERCCSPSFDRLAVDTGMESGRSKIAVIVSFPLLESNSSSLLFNA